MRGMVDARGGENMSRKGFRYAYPLKSTNEAMLGQELDKVGNAYQDAGWIEVDFLPEEGFPTHVVFEWQNDGPPIYPSVY